METKTLQDLWQLLQPSDTFATRGRYEHCLALWSRMDEGQRMRIYEQIAQKKQEGEYVNPNPCFAIDDALQADEMQQAKAAVRRRRQEMSYAEYYAKYGTTEEKDGWQMENPTGNKVIYVKN